MSLESQYSADLDKFHRELINHTKSAIISPKVAVHREAAYIRIYEMAKAGLLAQGFPKDKLYEGDLELVQSLDNLLTGRGTA